MSLPPELRSGDGGCQRAMICQSSGSSLNTATPPYDQLHTYWNASVDEKTRPAPTARTSRRDSSHEKIHSGMSCVNGSLGVRTSLAAWLCRRWTGATLSQLGPSFRLKGVDSVSNLVRRVWKRYKQSAAWRKTAKEIETLLKLNAEHKTCLREAPAQGLTPRSSKSGCLFE